MSTTDHVATCRAWPEPLQGEMDQKKGPCLVALGEVEMTKPEVLIQEDPEAAWTEPEGTYRDSFHSWTNHPEHLAISPNRHVHEMYMQLLEEVAEEVRRRPNRLKQVIERRRGDSRMAGCCFWKRFAF
ncbi:unnamed protein product [Durusdinium trenchii]|uniref:Uncharacterized protein n=1 Tax=Durusdinium trenchii TaxID=1381693 RepID=A0ABP0M521_9DINO